MKQIPSLVSRFVRWHRRGLAAAALAVAVVAGISAFTPHDDGGVPVVVAARDLAPGTTLTSSDLTVVRMPAEVVPGGAYGDVASLAGRSLSVGLTARTPITTAALTGAGLVDHDASEVLVPLRVRDAEVVGLLHVGDRLTIVVTTPEGVAQTLAEHIRVAQLPTSPSGGFLGGTGSSSGALIVVAAPRETATQLAGATDQWVGVIIE